MTVATERRNPIRLTRLPRTDDELWMLVRYLWGIEIPRRRVCDGHRAPFEAFADAYFARHPVIVVKASRGLAGKTFTLAHLAATEISVLGATVTLLGGSLEQSKNAHAYTEGSWQFEGAPRHLLKSDPSHRETNLRNGGWIKVLAASTRSARGPHPIRMRLDEVDEMSIEVFEAALGQPMSKPGIPVRPQTLISSTHHYPNKTFTYVLEELAPEKDWPVYEWCYRETRAVHDDDGEHVDGWLSDAEIEETRGRIPRAMWDTEYELQEPNVEGRAIDQEKVEAAFDANLGTFDGALDEYVEIEEPHPNATYAHGVDWAKTTDYTIIATFRTDVRPWVCVAWERTGRLPWPVMVAKFERRLRRYPPHVDSHTKTLSAAHDATGVGDVVDDYLDYELDDETPEGIKLVGARRGDLFSDYIAAIEDDAVRYPMIRWAYDEHRYVTRQDLYGTRREDHPPDSFVAGAVAWSRRTAVVVEAAAPRGERRTSPYRRNS